ncbi:MAG: hypothetical protein ACTHZ7_14605 [Sphingobacterium sp.]
MAEKDKNTTRFGSYLKKIGIKPSTIGPLIGMKPKTISLLSTQPTRTLYADEFYRLIIVAHRQIGLPEKSFKTAVDEVFPDRITIDLLAEYHGLSSEGKFFKKYTQQQTDLEEKLGIPNGKLSKYFAYSQKRALAIEIINFSEGMNLDVLSTFKEIYGEM